MVLLWEYITLHGPTNLKSVLRHKFLNPHTLYLREQGCENPWFFLLKPEKVHEQKKKHGKHWSRRYSDSLRTGRSGDQFSIRARYSAHVQTVPMAHPASYTMGNRYYFPEIKRPGRGVNDPPRSSADINSLNAELNPICYLLALLGAYHFLHLSRIRVKSLTLRLLI